MIDRRLAYQIPLSTYMGPWRIIEELHYGPFELRAVATAERDLERFNAMLRHGEITEVALELIPAPKETSFPQLSYVRHQAADRVSPQHFLINISSQPENPTRALGILTGQVPYVHPRNRGQGIGSEMIWRAEISGRGWLTPASYSPSGYRAYQAAHRKHVEMAIIAGRDVPDEVLLDYQDLMGSRAHMDSLVI